MFSAYIRELCKVDCVAALAQTMPCYDFPHFTIFSVTLSYYHSFLLYYFRYSPPASDIYCSMIRLRFSVHFACHVPCDSATRSPLRALDVSPSFLFLDLSSLSARTHRYDFLLRYNCCDRAYGPTRSRERGTCVSGAGLAHSLCIHDVVSGIKEGGLIDWPVCCLDVRPRRGRARLGEDYRPKCAGQKLHNPQ
jgi:hypothetical protein